MAREQFIDSLRLASRMLSPPSVSSDSSTLDEAHFRSSIHSADLWLTSKSVEGFEPADFADWPKKERDELAREVNTFRTIAASIPAGKPAPKALSKQARKHLERIIRIVRDPLLQEWLEAQRKMVGEATAAAETKGWYVEQDEKEVRESLLGAYKAPRLRIRTRDQEVVFDPIARFGSGQQGVVDLVIMPSYRTVYLVTFKQGDWQIVPQAGNAHSKPFNQKTLVNTISTLPHR